MKPNWKKIKAEYLKGGISQRNLAKKHGMSYSKLCQVATREHWATTRDELQARATAKAEQKIEEQIVSETAEAVSKLRRAQSLIADHVLALAENLPTIKGSKHETTTQKVVSDENFMPENKTVKETYDIEAIAETLEKLFKLYGVSGEDAKASSENNLLEILTEGNADDLE